jgi:3'-phosphoadenosine 5'-phosphosulfate sulfotransferase (PAPS reductase)/FAD synthetase
LEYVERAAALLTPTGVGFLDLCLWKGLFPSPRGKFCTEELKIMPIWHQVQRPILEAGRTLISWQGVRAEESLARRDLPRWQRVNPAPYKALKADRDLGEAGRAYAYRPLIDWKVDDVWAMHARHGIARNRLYDNGASRVGCFPCIHAGKEEIRMIADRFPEFIDRLAEWERMVTDASARGAKDGFAATFFPASSDPLYREGDPITVEGNGIHRTVEWSRTSRGGKQYSLLAMDFGTSCNEWGTCE